MTTFAKIEGICPGYTLEPIRTLRGYKRCVDLQMQVWNYADPTDAVPMALLAIAHSCGGILIGAYDRRHTLIGFVYSLLGKHEGRLVQHSHMLGVLPNHQNRRLGLALKLAQRKQTLQQGIQRIIWTYDPLQSLNAHFNFHRLGIWVDTYEVNMYGRSSSVLHRGLDTDRFLATWELNSDAVRRRTRLALRGSSYRTTKPDLPLINSVRTLTEWNQEPRGRLKHLQESRFLFEAPNDVNRLKRENLKAAAVFQRQLRRACLEYFKHGYRIVDFITDRNCGRRRCFYLFDRHEVRGLGSRFTSV